MKLEIENIGDINSTDLMKNDPLFIGVQISSKTKTVFLTLSKEHGADLEIALDIEDSNALVRLLEKAIETVNVTRNAKGSR